MLSTSKVAKMLGVTRQTVHNWIVAGKLPALKVGGVWRVWPEDLEAFMKKPDKATKAGGGDT